MGGAAPLPPIGGGTEPLAADRACRQNAKARTLTTFSVTNKLGFTCHLTILNKMIEALITATYYTMTPKLNKLEEQKHQKTDTQTEHLSS